MRVRTKALWTNEAMLIATGTYRSAAIRTLELAGEASLLVVTSAGSLALTYQVSDDETNWYDPEDTAGAALGGINAAVTVGSNWIVFNPSLARYTRIVAVLTGANSTVSMTFRLSEESY